MILISANLCIWDCKVKERVTKLILTIKTTEEQESLTLIKREVISYYLTSQWKIIETNLQLNKNW